MFLSFEFTFNTLSLGLVYGQRPKAINPVGYSGPAQTETEAERQPKPTLDEANLFQV